MNASSAPIASNPASTARPSVPWRVDNNFLVACMAVPSSAAHDRDAGSERVRVTGRRAGPGAERLDVLDEMADDVAGVVVGHGVVAVALARVVEALPLPGPSGHVERGEALHWHRRAAAAVERAVRRQE